jgi:hypothetical protein
MFRSISLNYAKSRAKSLDVDVRPLLLARAERDRLNDGEIAAVHVLLLAQSGYSATEFRCLLLGVKRTFLQLATMSVIDPKRTCAFDICCYAK